MIDKYHDFVKAEANKKEAVSAVKKFMIWLIHIAAWIGILVAISMFILE